MSNFFKTPASTPEGFVTGHDFSRAADAEKRRWALAPAVKGTSFSPYIGCHKETLASAPEGMRSYRAALEHPLQLAKKGQSLKKSTDRTSSGAKQAAKKDRFSNELCEKHTSGTEAPIDSIGFLPGMNPRSTARMSFSAACKAHFALAAVAARLKSCAVTKPVGPSLSKTFLAAALFAALLAPINLTSQQNKPWENIPIPKLHEFKPHQPVRIQLKNGIVIFLQEDHELPFVSGSVMIPGGSRDEGPAKAGLVGLYGQAWRTSGTAKMDGDALDDLLEAKAAHIETGGDEDSTTVAWDSLKGDADQVFSLAMDLLLHPKFNQEKLALAQQQEATGIVRRNDDESGIAERESAKLIYGANSPYTLQPELASIGSVTLDDLKAWHDRTVGGKEGGGKLIVGISGDFDPVAMEAKLRAAFEGLAPVKPTPARHDVFAGPTPGLYFIDKEDVNQSDVEIVGIGIDRHNPDVPTVAVMNEILGGGFASRLFQKVRTELGLAYEVGGGISFAYDHPGPFRAVALPQSAKTVDATKAVLAEIDGMNSTPFSEEELARAKDNLLTSFLFRYDTRDKVLAERERLEFYGYPADYLETYKAALEKVTLPDLEAAAKKYIHPDKLAILVVGNGPEIKPGLDELNLGPVHAIDIAIPQPGKPAAEEQKH